MPCNRLSILDGVTLGALETQLASMQQAYLALVSGTNVQSASYSQADGSRSVSYNQANIADLTQAIVGVQQQIDSLRSICRNRRRPITPFF
jgi:hypothetical protein